MTHESGQRGFALITVLMLLALIMSLLLAYFTLTHVELSTTRSSMNSTRGLYAAEAGLNVRADVVRQIFEGYNRPTGAGPSPVSPCVGTNQGSGDLACVEYGFQSRAVTTYLEEQPGNPTSIVIPRGERFQNLHAQEYSYVVASNAMSPLRNTEAVLEMRFKSRLVPMFQFAAFYNKDLEILPGPDMVLEGPVHTNGDLYLGGNNGLDIEGQVTTAGALFRGRKNTDTCMPGTVSVIDPVTLTELPACSGGTTLIAPADLTPWNGMVQTGVEVLTVPPPEALSPVPGEIYWDKADIRVMLDLNGGTPTIEVRDPDGTTNVADTATLAACGAATTSISLHNHREASLIRMLDIDAVAMLDCLHDNMLLGPSTDIDETSEGGLVWYLGVDGPASGALNNYGVRVRNGADLEASDPAAPEIRGLTVVTSQAVYVEGDYNAVDKKPAAFLADSVNVLSNDWVDLNSTLALASRGAASTTINAAFLGGTDSTGGIEISGVFPGQYNGGLENYPRFHEDWSGRTLTYRGSFVSLNTPLHVDGGWVYGGMFYKAPNRDWRYDTDFNNAENLPPLSPRFVYLRQELFIREFEL